MDKENNYTDRHTHTRRFVYDRSLMKDIYLSNELVRHLIEVTMGYIK